jgi:transposase
MQRRKFSREFKVEAVRLVRERDVSVAQASRDLFRLQGASGRGRGERSRAPSRDDPANVHDSR